MLSPMWCRWVQDETRGAPQGSHSRRRGAIFLCAQLHVRTYRTWSFRVHVNDNAESLTGGAKGLVSLSLARMGGLGLLISSQLGAADAPLGSIRFRVDKRSAGMPREWELDGMSLAAWRRLLVCGEKAPGLSIQSQYNSIHVRGLVCTDHGCTSARTCTTTA
ncbi:hypothetical protein J3E68DRAFT_133543 [Trichoderma sp. SZMC 28012]